MIGKGSAEMSNYRAALESMSYPIAIAVAAASFVALGTVMALWDNPLFFRMTPAGPLEISLLAIQSVLLGLFFSIRRAKCAGNQAGVGSIFAVLGLACPVCNKLLLIVFGSELLLGYFEPIRIYVAALGLAITAWALWRKLGSFGRIESKRQPAVGEMKSIAAGDLSEG